MRCLDIGVEVNELKFKKIYLLTKHILITYLQCTMHNVAKSKIHIQSELLKYVEKRAFGKCSCCFPVGANILFFTDNVHIYWWKC
jgi:hypothetical protein